MSFLVNFFWNRKAKPEESENSDAAAARAAGASLATGSAPLNSLPWHGLDWEEKTRRILTNPDPKNREYLWLGITEKEDRPGLPYPAVLHRSVLFQHSYFLGDPGCGKTTIGILPLVRQLAWHRTYNEAGEDAGPFCGIVVVDLKGDRALFESTRREALKAGRPFKFFTNEIGKATFGYNPWRGKQGGEVSLRQVAQTFLKALGLQHGPGFGRSYYSAMARGWLQRVLDQHPEVSSFDELRRYAENVAPEERKDIGELLVVIEDLAGVSQLNVTANGPEGRDVFERSIHLPDAVENQEIIYFWLPVAKEETTVNQIAKLVVYDLFQSGRGSKPTLLVIDEFQVIVSANLSTVMEQCRSAGVGLLMANQTLSGLRNQDADLLETVWGMTQFKQVFSVTDRTGMDYVCQVSGKKDRAYVDYGGYYAGARRGMQADTYITTNDLIAMNSQLYSSLCFVNRAQGPYAAYTPSGHPFFIKTEHSMSKREHDECNAEDIWPAAGQYPGTLVAANRVARPTAAAPPPPPSLSSPPAATRPAATSPRGPLKSAHSARKALEPESAPAPPAPAGPTPAVSSTPTAPEAAGQETSDAGQELKNRLNRFKKQPPA